MQKDFERTGLRRQHCANKQIKNCLLRYPFLSPQLFDVRQPFLQFAANRRWLIIVDVPGREILIDVDRQHGFDRRS